MDPNDNNTPQNQPQPPHPEQPQPIQPTTPPPPSSEQPTPPTDQQVNDTPRGPQDVGQIIGGAFRTLFRAPAATFGIAALGYLILIGVGAVSMLLLALSVIAPILLAVVAPVAVIAFLVASTVDYGLVLSAQRQVLAGEKFSIDITFREVFRQIWPLIGAFFLSMLIMWGALFVAALLSVGVGALAAPLAVVTGLVGIILMVYLNVKLSLAIPAVLFEGLSPSDAIKRSWELTKSHFWRTLGILLLGGLIATGVALVLMLIGVFTGLLAILFTIAVVVTVTPLVAGVVSRLYGDLASRHNEQFAYIKPQHRGSGVLGIVAVAIVAVLALGGGVLGAITGVTPHDTFREDGPGWNRVNREI